MNKSPPLAVLVLLLLASVGGTQPAFATDVRTVVLSFDGQASLGRSVATIFQLQLSSGLRKEPTPNPLGLNFGTSSVFWDLDPKFDASHEAAELKARQVDTTAQLVLWGSVQPVGNSTVVTTYLTLPKYKDLRPTRHEEWSLQFKYRGAAFSFHVDIPQRYYAFEPVVLAKDFVEGYSTPDQLRLLAAPRSNRTIGVLGDNWTFLKHEGPYSQVQAGGKTGWVHLPDLSKHKPEIIDFTGGIIRVYRADWAGALENLKAVVENKSSPTSIKVDALMFMLRAKSEINEDGSFEVGTLQKIAPASRRAIQYIAMYYFARCFAQRNDCSQDAIGGSLPALLLRAKHVFPPDDDWYGEALRAAVPRAG
jgi:hypothetical protein